MTATVDRFGRLVVPKEIRDRHGIVAGCELEVEDTGDSIVLRVATEPPGLVEKEGILVYRGRAAGDIQAATARHRLERLVRQGGGPR